MAPKHKQKKNPGHNVDDKSTSAQPRKPDIRGKHPSKSELPVESKKNPGHKIDDRSTSAQPRKPDIQGKPPSRNELPAELQQLLLDVVKDAFSPRFNEDLPSLIQAIKQHLYNRDFAGAFGKEAFLEAYAMRWSPSRALAYADLLCNIPRVSTVLNSLISRSNSRYPGTEVEERQHLNQEAQAQWIEPTLGSAAVSNLKVVCLGGGAGAELLAFAAFLHHADESASISEHHAAGLPDLRGLAPTLSIIGVDIGDWSSVLDKLYGSITTASSMSKYASPAERKAKTAFVDAGTMEMDFQQQDLLNMDPSRLGQLLEGCRLVTLTFTLNELYSTSMSSTTKLLLSMTELLEPGSLLLVIDSPGSYSTVDVGQNAEKGSTSTQKKYPMRWLLDHTLLEVAMRNGGKGSAKIAQWEKLDESESRWFRLPKGLEYPISLEDMRYQYHFYKRV